jgi:hypothetical protein
MKTLLLLKLLLMGPFVFAALNPFDALNEQHGEICADDLGYSIEVRNPEWETSIISSSCSDPDHDISEMQAFEEDPRTNILSRETM